MTTLEITCKQVQKELQPFAKQNNELAFWLAAVDVAGYCLLFWLTTQGPWWTMPFCCVGLGVLISPCFVLGHDAAHRSLFSGAFANRLFARLTNLKGRDPVWTPLDPAEYRALSPSPQRWYRACRTKLGFALYYGVELWWKKLFFPNRQEVAVHRREHTLDNYLVLTAMAAQVGLVWFWSSSASAFALNVLFAILVPTALGWWFMGFAIYVHHTHPTVVWFTDRGEWSFQAGQLEGQSI